MRPVADAARLALSDGDFSYALSDSSLDQTPCKWKCYFYTKYYHYYYYYYYYYYYSAAARQETLVLYR